ncbi:MAG: hypothetical protein WCA46_25120 [Actinocatenispora sp.]
MEFRELGEKRSLRRPLVEDDELDETPPELDGDMAVAAARYDGGEYLDAEIGGDLSRSVLSRVNLTGSRSDLLTLADVRIDHADLSNAAWSRLTARRVELTSCRATGWRVAFDLAWDLYVGDTGLNYATIELGKVKGLVVFERCAFRDVRIGGDLSHVLFLDCDLAGAEFLATRALGCDLRTSRLAGARGLLSLRGATVSGDQVVSVAEQLAVEVGLRIT